MIEQIQQVVRRYEDIDVQMSDPAGLADHVRLTELAQESAELKEIVDASGAPFPQSLDGVHGLAALRTVTVSGTVRTTEGGLVIDAEKIHVADS